VGAQPEDPGEPGCFVVYWGETSCSCDFCRAGEERGERTISRPWRPSLRTEWQLEWPVRCRGEICGSECGAAAVCTVWVLTLRSGWCPRSPALRSGRQEHRVSPLHTAPSRALASVVLSLERTGGLCARADGGGVRPGPEFKLPVPVNFRFRKIHRKSGLQLELRCVSTRGGSLGSQAAARAYYCSTTVNRPAPSTWSTLAPSRTRSRFGPGSRSWTRPELY
jgi:hypothetical protein